MTTEKDTAIEPWMEELWTWADKIELSEEDLPRDVNALIALEKLDLSGKAIIEILPESICNLKFLEELRLNSTSLKKLPKHIANLINLKVLSLSWTNIDALPKNVCDIVNIEELYIDSMSLKKLPKNFNNLVNLKTLNIGGNPELEIPPEHITEL